MPSAKSIVFGVLADCVDEIESSVEEPIALAANNRARGALYLARRLGLILERDARDWADHLSHAMSTRARKTATKE